MAGESNADMGLERYCGIPRGGGGWGYAIGGESTLTPIAAASAVSPAAAQPRRTHDTAP